MAARHVVLANGSLLGGGAERVIATLATQLRHLGHQVSILTLAGGGEVLDELRAQGFRSVAGLAQTNRIAANSTRAGLQRLVKEWDVDVIHTHDLRSLVDVGTCRRVNGGFRHVHTFHFGNYPHLHRRHLILEGIFARTPDQLVAVGCAQREALVKALRLSRPRVRVIWNGVDAPAETESAPGMAPRPGSVPVVGSVSAFFPQKGLPTLLKAVQIVHRRGIRFRLLLIGDGPLRAEIESLAADLGLTESVEFAGWRPDASKSVMPSLDVFVQSSNWEAMSMVVLEAMAARLPILATSVGDNPRVLQQDRTGILVPPADADALAAGLIRLLEDAQLRRRLADGAYASWQRRFGASMMARRYAATYERVLECGRG